MMIDFPFVFAYLRPGATWILDGNSYDNLIWTNGDEPPTLAECEAVWKEIEREYLLRPIRAERNRLLAASDWTQVADAPVNAAVWAEYRQALRDIPGNITDLENVVWPTPPE